MKVEGRTPLAERAWAAALGGLPVVVRLWEMGPDQRRAAVVAAGTCLVVSFVAGSMLASTLKLGLVTASVAGGVAATYVSVGRMPVLIGVAATLIALPLIAGPTVRGFPERSAPYLGSIGLLGYGVSWVVAGSNLLAASWLIASIGVLVAVNWTWTTSGSQPASRHLVACDASLGSTVDRLATWSRRRGAAAGARLGTMARHASLVSRSWGEGARRRARRARRAFAEWWRGQDPAVRFALILGLGVALATAPIFWRIVVDPSVMIRGTNDINSGLPRIADISLVPFQMTVAHPIYFSLIRVMTLVISPAVATTLIGSVSVGATVFVLILVARSRWDDLPRLTVRWSCVFGLSYVFLESAAVLIPRTDSILGRFGFASVHARGPGYLALHQWATPTIVMVTPFTFWMFALMLRVIEDVDERTDGARRDRVVLAVLTLFVTALLPAPTLVLGPASFIYLFATKPPTWARFTTMLRSFWGPGGVVILGEVVFLASKVSSYEQAEWLWRPFWVWSHFGMDRPALYLIYIVLPIAIWGRGRSYFREPTVVVPALGVLIGAIPFLFLEQTTVASVPDGDLGVPPLMSMWLLIMSSIRLILIEAQEVGWRSKEQGGRRTWVLCASGVLGLMLVAGIADLSAAMGLIRES